MFAKIMPSDNKRKFNLIYFFKDLYYGSRLKSFRLPVFALIYFVPWLPIHSLGYMICVLDLGFSFCFVLIGLPRFHEITLISSCNGKKVKPLLGFEADIN